MGRPARAMGRPTRNIGRSVWRSESLRDDDSPAFQAFVRRRSHDAFLILGTDDPSAIRLVLLDEWKRMSDNEKGTFVQQIELDMRAKSRGNLKTTTVTSERPYHQDLSGVSNEALLHEIAHRVTAKIILASQREKCIGLGRRGTVKHLSRATLEDKSGVVRDLQRQGFQTPGQPQLSPGARVWLNSKRRQRLAELVGTDDEEDICEEAFVLYEQLPALERAKYNRRAVERAVEREPDEVPVVKRAKIEEG